MIVPCAFHHLHYRLFFLYHTSSFGAHACAFAIIVIIIIVLSTESIIRFLVAGVASCAVGEGGHEVESVFFALFFSAGWVCFISLFGASFCLF